MTDLLDALRKENEALRAKAGLAPGASGNDAALLRAVLDAVPGIITRVDAQGRIRFLNRYLPGYRPEDVLGRPAWEYVEPQWVPLARECIERVIRTGEAASYSIVGAGSDGTRRRYQTIVQPIEEADGERGACLVSLDVTDQVAREQALRTSEEALRIAATANKMGFWRWDLATNEVEWSESMRELTGYADEVEVHTYLQEIVHPDDREQMAATVAQFLREPIQWRAHRIARRDGAVRWIMPSGQLLRDESGKPLCVVGVSLDITEQRAIEERLQQTEKLEALGSLTAGVAHNFNNMLAVILPFLDQVVHTGRQEPELAMSALQAAQRATQLIRQLMKVAGKRRASKRVVCDLCKIVQASADICRPILEGEVALTLELPALPIHVAGDEAELEQVIVNLCLNARDAMVEARVQKPEIHIVVSQAESGTVPELAGRQGAYACATVRDNGPGMDEAIRARLFEPFFTTKGPDRGTGLGLATSRSVVRGHDGALVCESVVGRGSTFTMSLPLVVDGLSSSSSSRSPPQTAHALTCLRVLVVDDDAGVRGATRSVLEAEGHHVVEAAGASDAIERMHAEPAVDVVLLDRTMPKLSGGGIVGAIRRICPAARVFYFTGGDVPDDERAEVDGVLHKPATRKALAGCSLAAGHRMPKARLAAAVCPDWEW